MPETTIYLNDANTPTKGQIVRIHKNGPFIRICGIETTHQIKAF